MTTGTDVRTLRSARVASSFFFAAHGVVAGTFGARLPWVADHVGVGVGGLGIALLMPGIGALLAMPVSGRLIHRFDLRVLGRVLILCFAAALILPSLATNLPLLCLTLIVYGATAGLADVAINSQAVLIEERYGRSVMSSFHGWWSVGGLAGSAVAALAARADLDGRVHFVATAIVLAVITVVASFRLLPHRPAPELDAPPAFALPSKAVLAIGLVGLCAVFAEASGLDWSAVYVRDTLGNAASTAAFTVSVFSVSMAAARFAGDGLVRRIGAVTTVRLSGVCATIGALTVVLGHHVVLVIIGFGLIGAGIAVVVPLVFAAAGRIGDSPARSLAGVAGIAYGSGLIAPGVIGGVGHAFSLTVSFVLVAGLTAVMGIFGTVLRPGQASAAQA